MMYDRVLSNPRGGDLQDRVENHFLAWANSIRRDLEALGVLDPVSGNDALLAIPPSQMTDEQLEAALALFGCQPDLDKPSPNAVEPTT
jgi:hypothetical protein